MSNLICPRCKSNRSIKKGRMREKQRYICKNCEQIFYGEILEERVEKTDYSNLHKTFVFEQDVWYIEALGVSVDALDNNRWLNFSEIKQPWLKTLSKRHIKLEANGGAAPGSLTDNLRTLKHLSKYLEAFINVKRMEDLLRDILLDFVQTSGKSFNVKYTYLTALRKFIENGNINGWFNLPDHLIRQEDYPKRQKRSSNDIPKIVFDQIEDKLHLLPDPIARMVIVGFFCAMRISELQLCLLNCLKQDTKGNWSIKFWRKKSEDYHVLPISREVVKIIQQQQTYIKQHFGDSFKYLFCGRVGGKSSERKPVAKVVRAAALSYAVNRLIKDENIRDENGKLWQFTAHQLRDSRATYLFETGHEFAVVSKWLGHKELGTTQKYVHVKDHTLRDETAKVQAKLTNIRGEALNWEDLPETLQKNPNTHTLAILGDHINTPIYGYCGLPLDEDCPHWKACYTCPSFIARREELPDYIRIRDELRDKLARASQNGETVKVDQFKQQADSLDEVIAGFGKVA